MMKLFTFENIKLWNKSINKIRKANQFMYTFLLTKLISSKENGILTVGCYEIIFIYI